MKKIMILFINLLIASLTLINCSDSGEDSPSYRLARHENYDAADTLVIYWICKYYSDGRVNQILAYNSEDILQSTSTHTYDSEGRIIRTDTAGGDQDGYYKTNFYDTNGKPSRSNFYDSSDTLLTYIIYHFNTDGQKISSESYDGSDNLRKTKTFSYDSTGKRISSTDGTNTSTYFYDSNGNLSQITFSDGYKMLFIFEEGKTTIDIMMFGEW